MAADGAIAPAKSVDDVGSRPGRAAVMGFAIDADSEAALRNGLAEAVPQGLEIRRGDIRSAIATLRRTATPHVLIVDISQEDQPLAALDDLSQVVEPDVRVLVVGDRADADFYRRLTRSLGIAEYLYKPLTADMVARHFVPAVRPGGTNDWGMRGGRVIAVTGARGGVGVTTVAVNLAWTLSETGARHTALMDSDLHTGTAALLLGAKPGPGLRAALEAPERVDELFVERAATAVRDRLHVLAAEESLGEPLHDSPGAAERLLGALRRRYNFVVLDIPFRGTPLHRELWQLSNEQVVVMDPSLPSVRDALRLLALPRTALQPRRPMLVLNRAGRPGGLATAHLSKALEFDPDVSVPDMARKVEEAATLGQPVAANNAVFRKAMEAVAQYAGSIKLAPPSKFKLFGFRK